MKEEGFDMGLFINSILCTIVCWLCINNFVFPISLFKFVLLEFFISTMHRVFVWVHKKINNFN
jgi:hypothetical protein